VIDSEWYCPFFVRDDAHFGCDRKMLDPARYASADRRRQWDLFGEPARQLLLDLQNHVPRVRYVADVHHLEGVERVAVPGGVDLRVDEC